MIRKERGELIAECNECGDEFPGGVLEWSEFIADLKANGWRIKKDGDEWIHECESCQPQEFSDTV